MARADVDPGDRDRQPLRLANLVDCPNCDTTFDVVYVCASGVYDLEDLIEPPTMTVTCPRCEWSWEREWEGWTEHGSAGG